MSSIFLGNLPSGTTEEQVRAFAKGHSIESVDMKRQRSAAGGYCFLYLTEGADLEAAAAAMNGKPFADGAEAVRCEVARPKPERKPRAPRAEGEAGADGSARRSKPRRRRPVAEKPPMIKEHGLFVANLPFSVDGEGLKAIFEEGPVKPEAAYIITKRSGRSKGFGFVKFASDADRDQALKFATGKVIEERELSVSAVQPREDDEAKEE